MISWYAPSTLPRSWRKRSLSSFSWVLASQNLQVSGQISSASKHRPVRRAPELELEVDEQNVSLRHEFLQHLVHRERLAANLGELVRRGPTEHDRVIVVDHRIVELVALVVELHHRSRQHFAVGPSETLPQAAGHEVSNHRLAGNDLQLPHQHLALIELGDEVARDAVRRKKSEEPLRDAIVEHAFRARSCPSSSH